MDAPGPLDLGEKAVQVLLGPHIGITRHGTEDELHARLIDEHEGPGVLLLQAGQLGLHPPGHEVDQYRAHFVVEDQGTVVFIQDLQAEAHRAFQLPPDGGIAAQVHLQKAVVDRGIGRGDVEVVQVFPFLQHPGHFFIKLFGVEADAFRLREEDDAGEVFRGLDVHVFVEIQVGQLGPEGDVQGEGQIQGRFRLVVGQNGHGGGH